MPAREILVAGVPAFPFADHVTLHHRFPVVDWERVIDWVHGIADPDAQERAWRACERNWLLWFRDALGPSYAVHEGPNVAVVSSQSPKLAAATVAYLERTLRRIVGVLDGVAAMSGHSREVLILFESQDDYYHYVSHRHPESGEFALSSGMYLRTGHGHFITTDADLTHLEPVLAHEMTHACVSHLTLPLWLNEGLAVNTENRLAGAGGRPLHTAHEIHDKHVTFWNERLIQDYWSGDSFHRTDEGTMLSYELARTMAEQLSGQWEPFRTFATTASWNDAGAAAARAVFDIDLGALVCALLEREPAPAWSPDPSRWTSHSTTPGRMR